MFRMDPYREKSEISSLSSLHPEVDYFGIFCWTGPAPCGQPGGLETWETQQ